MRERIEGVREFKYNRNVVRDNNFEGAHGRVGQKK